MERPLLPLTVVNAGCRRAVDQRSETLPRRPGHDHARSRLTSEVFIIEDGEHSLVYAPLRRTAFVTNAAAVGVLTALQNGQQPDGADDLVTLLRQLGLCDGPRDHPPRPTSVTLFLTTACNLRCDYS